MAYRANVAYFGAFDASCLCLTIETLASGALGRDGVVERTAAIQQSAHQPPFLPVEVFDTALAFDKLGLLTARSSRLREEQGTAKALSAKAVGVLKEEGGMHTQAFGAAWGAIGIARDFFVAMAIERDGSDARPVSHRLIDVPVVVSGISGHMGRELIGGHDGLLEEGAIIRDVSFIEGQGVLSEHHLAIDGVCAGGHSSPIAKEADLFLFLGAIRLLLIAAFLDAQATIGIAFGNVGHSEGAFDVDIGVVLAHPGKDVLDIEGHHLAQSGDLLHESPDSSMQEVL